MSLEFDATLGQITEFRNHEKFISGLIHDYWKQNPNKETGFFYTVVELAKKYGLKNASAVEAVVSKTGYMSISTILACGVCESEVKLKLRRDVRHLTLPNFEDKKSINFCRSCYADKQVSTVERLISDAKFFIAESDARTASTTSLSHLEKIFLLSLLNSRGLTPNAISYNEWEQFRRNEMLGAEFIPRSLIDKGYLQVCLAASEVEKSKEHAWQLLKDLKNIIDDEKLIAYKSTVKSLRPPHPMVIRPSRFQTYHEFSVDLLSGIRSFSTNMEDIKEIQEYIFSKRVAEINQIYEFVCREKRVPLSNNARKTMVFHKMARHLNLLECMNCIDYIARNVKNNIDDKKVYDNVPYQSMQVIYRLNSWIDKLIDSQKERFEKNIPKNLFQNKTESLISREILGIDESWEKYTAPQVLSAWIDKMVVDA